MRRLIVLLAALVVTGAGCSSGSGSGAAPADLTAARKPAAAPVTTTPAPPTSTPAPPPPPPPAAPEAVPASTPPSTTPLRTAKPADPATKGQPIPVSVKAAPCVAAGSVLPVTVQTAPDADVAIIIAFSDGEAHDSAHLGTTDAAGRYEANLPISPEAPPGQARLMVAGASNGRGGSAEQFVNVVAAGAPCP